MTEYERGFLDCRERAADVCLDFGAMYCREAILSLTPEAPDSQPEGVVVPRDLLMRCARQISELASIRHQTAYRTTEKSGPLLDAISYALAAAKEERDAT